MRMAGDVTVRIFDVTGRVVYSGKETLDAGKNVIQLDGKNVDGSGVYFYEISTDTESAQYKMIKLK